MFFRVKPTANNTVSQYPIFGSEIKCPHCQETIPALVLTDTYLCPRHGAFEVSTNNRDLVHLQSDRQWRLWDDQWYRQHNHPDGIRFEIHEHIDQLYTQGYRAIKVIIADRYSTIVKPYLESSDNDPDQLRLYGLSVEFSPPETEEPRWGVINFEIEKELGNHKAYSYFRSI
ncbi:TIGR02652 family protein [Pseudanabaena sp. FACHB-1277]|uniref:TIGR02652 family protein n=1 Tax=Pseudanabaena cinerea FACHB-1277 TaxID=2949581 RepID=A0A926USG9_9CYAN|nr:TIGR02652 family protein [Pseudanabaena cinerea]MBD2149893.1 TIGR02652 family protein [Pseudanabaena cinerea FACHB-1277]